MNPLSSLLNLSTTPINILKIVSGKQVYACSSCILRGYPTFCKQLSMLYDQISFSTLMPTAPSTSPYRLALLPTAVSANTELLESDRSNTSSPAIVPLVSSASASPLALSLDTSKMKSIASEFSATTSANVTHRKGQTGMNGGRWTDQEHQSFLAGLRLYGREWKKVAAKIKTRTSAQIRSHAQKYFAKLTRDDEMRKLSGLSTVMSGPVGYFSDGGSSVAQNSGDDDVSGSDGLRQKACRHSAGQTNESAANLTAPMGPAVSGQYKQPAGITKKRSRTVAKGFGDRTDGSPVHPYKHQKRTNGNTRIHFLPSQEELLAKASPDLRHRLSSLIDSELCALQVLSCYAMLQQHDQTSAACQKPLQQVPPRTATANTTGLASASSLEVSILPTEPLLSTSTFYY